MPTLRFKCRKCLTVEIWVSEQLSKENDLYSDGFFKAINTIDPGFAAELVKELTQ